jgi:hypothetical protein
MSGVPSQAGSRIFHFSQSRSICAWLVVFCLVLQFSIHVPARVSDQTLGAGLTGIEKQKIRAVLEFLASRSLKGRATGSQEAEVTAAYISSWFQRNGLIPLAKDGSSFIQEFQLTQALPTSESLLRVCNALGETRDLTMGEDYVPAPWGRDYAEISAETLFAGYGIRAPQYHYDDYAGIGLKDKVAVILSKVPSGEKNNPFALLTRLEYDDLVEKTHQAELLGAVGLLVILSPSEELPSASEKDIKKARAYLTRDVESIHIPAAILSYKAGETLLQGAPGHEEESLSALKNRLDELIQPKSFSLAKKVSLKTRYTRHDFPGFNVVGKISGSDPKLSNQAILVGAHHDHIGVSEEGEIFYGADDDASGTTGVLELAEAFQRNKIKPRRSLLLAAWGAEEIGLLGSRYYVQNPLHPLQQTVAEIQLDMIGRNEERSAMPSRKITEERPEDNTSTLSVNGSPFSSDLKAALEKNSQEVGLHLKFRYDTGEDNLIKRSDQWQFLKAGIPSVLLFTGFHPDYHKVSDTADKINYEKLERILKLVYLTVWELADETQSPVFNESLFEQNQVAGQ